MKRGGNIMICASERVCRWNMHLTTLEDHEQHSCCTIQEQIVCGRNLRCQTPFSIMAEHSGKRNWRERTAIVFSLGCQLACRIFLLKSNVSICIASLSPPGRGPAFAPFFMPGSGPPIFLALKADLSACRTTSLRLSASNIRKKLW